MQDKRKRKGAFCGVLAGFAVGTGVEWDQEWGEGGVGGRHSVISPEFLQGNSPSDRLEHRVTLF